MTVIVPDPSLVVLVGPSGSGKSSWAEANLPAEVVVSSDRLRGVVGTGPDDLDASEDAFDLLERIVEARLRRRLTTVVDTLGLDPTRRARWRDLASDHGVPSVLVAFDVPAQVCRERNRERVRPVPAAVLAGQLKTWGQVRDHLDEEGYDLLISPAEVRLVGERLRGAVAARARQAERPTGLAFGLQIGSFTHEGGSAATAEWLRETAHTAEACGFEAIYVMDHFRQIPQVGRPWEDMLESWTTLAYLAACTDRVRLGTLVTGVTYRNVAHLGRIVATLDVLSGGRAVCGLGLGWFEQEHRAYGWPFPPNSERYALLEDALQLLPLLWGPGSPAFRGQVLDVPEAMGYPRPLQAHLPILLGGAGERRTLRLAARYADASNVFGDAGTVRHKAEVLAAHCRAADRDPDEVVLTHLSTTLVGPDDAGVSALIDRLRPRGMTPVAYAASVNAGTVDDQVGRFRELAEAGVGEAVVRLADLSDPGSLERFGRVIAAFR